MRRYFDVVFLAAARHRRNESNWRSRIGIVLIEYERYRVGELKALNAALLNHEGNSLTIEVRLAVSRKYIRILWHTSYYL